MAFVRIFLITESASDEAVASSVNVVLHCGVTQVKLRRTSKFSSVSSINAPHFGQGKPALLAAGRVVIFATSEMGLAMVQVSVFQILGSASEVVISIGEPFSSKDVP
jgi:hypothetical protein